MLFADCPILIRGGGDLGSGAVFKLHRAGFPVIVLELPRPLAVRRGAAFAQAAVTGHVEVEGISAVAVDTGDEALTVSSVGTIAVLVNPDLPEFSIDIPVLVDARMAKRNLGTSLDQAGLVIALGPGFTAGVDCHAVVETMRGHRLGRVIWDGAAAPDTGVPGMLGGAEAGRVIRAPAAGEVAWTAAIGDTVEAGAIVGAVGDVALVAPLGGVVRGLMLDGAIVATGDKIGDIDPRGDAWACFEISDKSRLVGGGVLEAVLTWLNRSSP